MIKKNPQKKEIVPLDYHQIIDNHASNLNVKVINQHKVLFKQRKKACRISKATFDTSYIRDE